MYNRGEIVLVPVPFSDLSASKRRPVLVISNTKRNNVNSDMIVVAITSNIRQDGIVIQPNDLVAGNLPKTSLIRFDKIYTLKQNIVVKRFGEISADVLDNVVREINNVIA